jgi:hypothetical protein
MADIFKTSSIIQTLIHLSVFSLIIVAHFTVQDGPSGRSLAGIVGSNPTGQWLTQEFFSGGGGFKTNSVEDRGQREQGSGGSSPLVRGSGGSCNLVQEISFHMVNYS